MRPIIGALGMSAIFVTTLAMAQTAAPRGGPSPGMEAGEPPPPPPPGGPRAGRDAPPPPPGGPRGGRDGPPPPPAPKGAHFLIERGDARVDVKCADDEPMRACADIAVQLVDRLVTIKPAAAN